MLDKINEFIAQPLPRQILFFDEMLTPKLIRLAYWLGLLAVVWITIGDLFSNGFFGFFETIVQFVIGVIVVRVAAELVMVLFKLHDNSSAIVKNTAAAQTAAKPSAKKVTKKAANKKVSKKA